MNIDKIASNGQGFCVLFGYFFLLAMSVSRLWGKALDKPMENRFPLLVCAAMIWFFGARAGDIIGQYMGMAEYVNVFTWAAIAYIMIRYFQRVDSGIDAEKEKTRPERKD